MNLPHFFFLISISFQLSGALILIFFCWGKTNHKILNMIYPSNSTFERDDNDMVKISKDKLCRANKEVLLNRTAFIFIGLGYLLSVFGTNEGLCPWHGLLFVIVMSIFMMCIGYIIAHFIAKASNKMDRSYHYDELCSIIDVDVATNMTIKEVDEIIQ